VRTKPLARSTFFARLTRPDLPVVLMTGYADADVLDEHLRHAVLLKKPFRRLELAAALDAAAAPRRRRHEDRNAVARDPPRN
jgi:FixJ family two-component response regulator